MWKRGFTINGTTKLYLINTFSHKLRIKGQMKTVKTLKSEIENALLRKDGKLNSPAIKSPANKILVKEATDLVVSYIGDVKDFAQVWWHIYNETLEHPKCIECGGLVNWKYKEKRYNCYCSHNCAVKSSFARERTRKYKTGITRSETSKIKQSNALKGRKHSETTKQKLSEQKRGEKNPAYKKVPWNYNLTGPENPNYGRKRPGTGLPGIKNPNYGKPPSQKAGRGIWGKFNGQHFRSSLELFYLIYWYENNITVISAETNEYRVEYTSFDLQRTYSPDFFVVEKNMLVELKPENLHSNKEVTNKFNALKRYHTDKNCEMFGFKEIGSFIRSVIETDKIKQYLKQSLLQIKPEQYDRLVQNYDNIIRSTF